MTALQITWTVVFAAAVVLLLAVEVVVIVGGARDIVDMAKSLLSKARHEKDAAEVQ